MIPEVSEEDLEAMIDAKRVVFSAALKMFVCYTCGHLASAPMHDPKYGTHLFGETLAEASERRDQAAAIKCEASPEDSLRSALCSSQVIERCENVRKLEVPPSGRPNKFHPEIIAEPLLIEQRCLLTSGHEFIEDPNWPLDGLIVIGCSYCYDSGQSNSANDELPCIRCGTPTQRRFIGLCHVYPGAEGLAQIVPGKVFHDEEEFHTAHCDWLLAAKAEWEQNDKPPAAEPEVFTRGWPEYYALHKVWYFGLPNFESRIANCEMEELQPHSKSAIRNPKFCLVPSKSTPACPQCCKPRVVQTLLKCVTFSLESSRVT